MLRHPHAKGSKASKEKRKFQQNKTSANDVSVGEVDAVSVTSSSKKRKKNTTGQKSTQMKGNKFVKKDLSVRNENKGNFRGKGQFYNQNQEQDPTKMKRKKFVKEDHSTRNGNKGNRKGKAKLYKRNQDRTCTIRIHDKEVVLRYYGGFPVREEDWEQLTKLEKKLRDENVPEEKIMATMKLQRRRAERALSRERKRVCFNCQEAGHLLSECPGIGEAQFGKKDSTTPDTDTTGRCLKCGSLEHTRFECKVVKHDSNKFDKCFESKERGNNSQQCPVNPEGLYRKKAGCSKCGDVTHFKRDCPKYQKTKQEIAVTVPTLKQEAS